MLTNKQMKMLIMLDKQVAGCRKCKLHESGIAVPKWTPKSRYAIIGEAPGYNEVRLQMPFVGAAGKILTDELSKSGFKDSDFIILNTVQCRPVDNGQNSKPSNEQIASCRPWIRKYLKIIRPEKILCLGNYASSYFTGYYSGILGNRGIFRQLPIDYSSTSPKYSTGGDYPVLFTVHPAYCIYNADEGIPLLREDIKLFKTSKFERESEWLFSEEDFRV